MSHRRAVESLDRRNRTQASESESAETNHAREETKASESSPRSRADVVAIRMPPDHVDILRVSDEHPQRCDLIRRPQPRRGVHGPRGKIIPERCERHVPHRIVVAFVDHQVVLGREMPQANGRVLGGGEQVLAFGTDRRGVDGTAVTDQLRIGCQKRSCKSHVSNRLRAKSHLHSACLSTDAA
jgi:hypothetical protein